MSLLGMLGFSVGCFAWVDLGYEDCTPFVIFFMISFPVAVNGNRFVDYLCFEAWSSMKMALIDGCILCFHCWIEGMLVKILDCFLFEGELTCMACNMSWFLCLIKNRQIIRSVMQCMRWEPSSQG